MSGKRAAMLGAVLVLAAAAPLLLAQEAEWKIANPKVFGSQGRPAVRFTHLQHMTMEGVTCLDCHHSFVNGEKVLGDPSLGCATCHAKPLALTKSYHLLCIGCHDTARNAVRVTGPRACGECHVREK